MSADLSKAYELLGVKPGVSPRDLKAAHRDLAKVWHPDRFLHDPRLQEKAQEKLKEINEAYELLSSGKIPRSVQSPPREPQTVYTERATTTRRARNGHGVSVALLLFLAVFAVTITLLLQRRSQPLPQESVQIEESPSQDQPVRPDSNTRAEAGKPSQKPNAENPAAEVTSPVSVPTEPTPAVETVTVTIDPETGLLAKADCPVRSRMTYPSGSQPSGYCNLSHTPPPKDSRIKSIATKVFSK